MNPISDQHPIRRMFGELVHRAFCERLDMRGEQDVERYVTDLLVNFMHDDGVYAIRNAEGRKVRNIVDMVLEGDVRFHADSFDREREVHKHIGDFLLFWTGMFPEFVRRMKQSGTRDILIDIERQGRLSYAVVSEFKHEPYGEEAPLFGRLSARFDRYVAGLRVVREELGPYAG